MRFVLFLFIFLVSSSLFGQDKIYATYTTETGMGIQITYNNLPINEVHTPITSAEYDFIDAFWISAKTNRVTKKYVRFKKDGKMGIINAKGREIIPATYDTIQLLIPITGEDTYYFHDFFLFEKEDQVWVQRCSDLKRLFPGSYDSICYDCLTGDLRCIKNNRATYYCNDGKKFLPKIEFEFIHHNVLSKSNFYEKSAPLKIIAKQPGKAMSVYSETESFTNKEEADLHGFIHTYEDNQEKYLVVASKNGKMGVLDELGNIRIPFLYDSLVQIRTRSNNVGLKRLLITLNGKEGLCDYHGKLIFLPEYKPGSFSENKCYYNKSIFIVEKDTNINQGVVDGLGTEIIPIQEQLIEEHIHNGYYKQHYFYVTRNGKKGVFDFEGNEVIPCKYYNIYDENSVNHSAEVPDFKTFNTQQEYYDYWGW